MKQAKLLILTLMGVVLTSLALKAQQEVRYGFIQDPQDPTFLTAVIYPNFTSNNVTISTAVFTFMVPEGTVVWGDGDTPLPNLPINGNVYPVPLVNQHGTWVAQKLRPQDYATLSPVNPKPPESDLEGKDVYQVVLQNSPIPPQLTAGQPYPLFSIKLPDDCMDGDVEILINDSPLQQAIFQNLFSNFNNQMSISIDDSPTIDRYAGNQPNQFVFPCELDGKPDAVNDTTEVEGGMMVTVAVIENDTFGKNGPDSNFVMITANPTRGAAIVVDDINDMDPTNDSIKYTAPPYFNGTDSLKYKICDLDGDCDTATVYITIKSPDFEVAKTFTDATNNGDGTFTITYDVKVTNIGNASGQYTLKDDPGFDPDVVISGASYSLNGGVLTPIANVGSEPWTLGSGLTLAPSAMDVYTLVITANLNFSDNIGNEQYDACAPTDTPGFGLYNNAFVDLNGDDDANDPGEDGDDDCGDLPADFELAKTFVSSTNNGDGTFDVVYNIKVTNVGGQSGSYDLGDTTDFDDAVVLINGSSYMVNGGSAIALDNSGEWSLAVNKSLAAGAMDTYVLTVKAQLDLTGGKTYDACDANTNTPGTGLYNRASLDDRGSTDTEESDDCGDLPADFELEKTFVSSTNNGDGTFDVVYNIKVTNVGGQSGNYDLGDTTDFDDAVVLINGSSYMVNGGSAIALDNSGEWSLAVNKSLAAGAMDTYVLTVKAQLDLTGGKTYDACDANTNTPGKGLYNRANLDDQGSDDTEESDDCGDLPADFELEKTFVSSTNNGDGTFDVVYNIKVTNVGGQSGNYDLGDTTDFDDAVMLATGSSYMVNGSGAMALDASGQWVLAMNRSLAAGAMDTYVLTLKVKLDLTGGKTYDACDANTNTPGTGLYNRANLDDRGSTDTEESDDCGDLAADFELEKTFVSSTNNGDGTFDVVYNIKVTNVGGQSGSYDLGDTTDFDDAVVLINGSSYMVNGGSAIALNNSGQWVLASNQSLAAGAMDTYVLTVKVQLDLTGGKTYDGCDANTNTPGTGLYNRANLDDRGSTDTEESDDCGDLDASFEISKTFQSAVRTAPGIFAVTYQIKVSNVGGSTGTYTLKDQPSFDNDIAIDSARYSKNTIDQGLVSPLTAPWTLATNASLAGGAMDIYMLTVYVHLELEDNIGDELLSDCNFNQMGQPQPGFGTYNLAWLDDNNNDQVDGNEPSDDSCGNLNDVPVANPDFATTNEGESVDIDILDNDSFGGDGPGTVDVVITDQPNNGTATVINTGDNDPTNDSIRYTPNPFFFGMDTLIYKIEDADGDMDTALVVITIEPGKVRLDLKVLLQGSLIRDDGDNIMRDDLRVNGLIPLTEPYAALSATYPQFTHVANNGGGETISNPGTVLSDRGTASIVDWVFVELRDANDSTQVVATRSGLVTRTGDVVDTNGVAPLTFCVQTGDYYVSVRHRNHLGVMTKTAITLSATGTVVDFRLLSTDVYELAPTFNGLERVLTPLGNRAALWAGNTNVDDRLIFAGQNNDKDPIFNNVDQAPNNALLRLQTFNHNGYWVEDVDMNGVAIFAGQNNDVDPIFNNVDGYLLNVLRLQTFVINEQLPK